MVLYTVLTLSLFVAGCGVDVATTAATVAASKAEEAKQAQQTQERMQKKVDAAMTEWQEKVNQMEQANQ